MEIFAYFFATSLVAHILLGFRRFWQGVIYVAIAIYLAHTLYDGIAYADLVAIWSFNTFVAFIGVVFSDIIVTAKWRE